MRKEKHRDSECGKRAGSQVINKTADIPEWRANGEANG